MEPLGPGVETLAYSVKVVPLPEYRKALSVGICQYTSPATAGDFNPSIVDFFTASLPIAAVVSNASVTPASPKAPVGPTLPRGPVPPGPPGPP